jgi:DNA-binding MarR family transcriptional regulator
MTDEMPDWCHPPPDIHEAMSDIFQMGDMRVFYLFRALKHTSHLMDALRGEHRKEGMLSAARMRVLVRLTIDDRLGKEEGLQPSELSDHLGISRNTVSALLNGLEEQGLIERHLHPTDRRQLLIRITPEGKTVVHQHAPEFGAYLRDLFSSLSEEEQVELLNLLDKLFVSFLHRAVEMGMNLPGMTVKQEEPD